MELSKSFYSLKIGRLLFFMLGVISTVALFQSCVEDESEPNIVTSIEVEPSETSIDEGEEKLLIATVYDQNGNIMEGINLIWTSSIETVATVDATGLVTGLSRGEAMIKASYENIEGSSSLMVKAPPVVTRIVVLPETAKGSRGDSEQFTAQVFDQYDNEMFGFEIEWKSNYPCIAGVDELGMSSAISMGKTNIYASVEGVTGSALLEVEGIMNETNPNLNGDWMVCFEEDKYEDFNNYPEYNEGQNIYLINIELPDEPKISENYLNGTVTKISTGLEHQLRTWYYSEKIFDLIWIESFVGLQFGFFIRAEENINENLFLGNFHNEFRGRNFTVRVVRQLPNN